MDFINQIIAGDSLHLISELPDNCINLVICSPPYFNQRLYTGLPQEIGQEQETYDYISTLLTLFKQCTRVLKDDGSIVFNLGDKYINGSLALIPWRFAAMVCVETDAKLINQVTWVKTNPTPRPCEKRKMVCSTEPFFHFVKSSNYKYHQPEIVKRAKQSGSKIGQSYFKTIQESGLTYEQKAVAIMELKDAIKQVNDGVISSFRMKIKGKHALPYGGQAGGRMYQIKNKGFTIIKMSGGEMQRDVFECPVETIRGIGHPAIYPKEIVERFILLTTEVGDLVLDPFMGSGTTAVACKGLDRNYTGFDLCQDFVDKAKERVNG